MTENTTMLTAITRNRKVVPQRSWMREHVFAFSGVMGSPCSKQLIVLCSAPWYMNTRRISFIAVMATTYSKKMSRRSPPWARLYQMP